MRRRKFAPWRRQFQIGAALLLGGGATLLICFSVTPFPMLPAAAGMVLLAVAAATLKAAFMRWRGKRVERSSIRSLQLPLGWECRANLKLSIGGDVDLFLQAPGGDRFAVEIKSFESLAVRRGFLGFGRPRLTDAHGRELPRDPMGQTIRNARALSARPVLWLPKARGRTLGLGNGVIVVPGPGDQLLRAVGARRPWWRFFL